MMEDKPPNGIWKVVIHEKLSARRRVDSTKNIKVCASLNLIRWVKIESLIIGSNFRLVDLSIPRNLWKLFNNSWISGWTPFWSNSSKARWFKCLIEERKPISSFFCDNFFLAFFVFILQISPFPSHALFLEFHRLTCDQAMMSCHCLPNKTLGVQIWL